MICYLRASTVQYDVRLQKYIQACEETHTPYIAFTWDRVQNCTKVYDNEIQFKRLSPYGRKWKNLFNLILWHFHLIKLLFLYRKEYKVIHACNIETILPALFMKMFGKKVAFDIYDSVIIPVEKFVSKHLVDLLILPNVRRCEQIGITKDQVKHFLEIENVPSFSTSVLPQIEHNIQESIHLSYVGVFERQMRGLENLIQEVVENSSLTLDIAGIGAGLEQMVKDAAQKTKRIVYHGSVDYPTALKIMGKSDFIVAMYYHINPLHQFASPNKYYESLFLGVPMITTSNTLVGNMAVENKTGYAIGETRQDLHEFLTKALTLSFKKSYNEYANNASSLWKEKFSNYWQKELCDNYLQTLSLI